MRFSSTLLVCISWLVVSSCAVNRTYLEETPVLVTEVHYDPSDTQGKVEFIELTNFSGEPINLSGWQVTGAGRVVLPAGTVVGPGKAVVLTRDLDAFTMTFGGDTVPTPVATLPGKLKNKGEIIRVEDPQGRVADEVEYDPSNPEVEKAGGTGRSLHRADIDNPDAGETWRAADPTPGVYKG